MARLVFGSRLREWLTHVLHLLICSLSFSVNIHFFSGFFVQYFSLFSHVLFFSCVSIILFSPMCSFACAGNNGCAWGTVWRWWGFPASDSHWPPDLWMVHNTKCINSHTQTTGPRVHPLWKSPMGFPWKNSREFQWGPNGTLELGSILTLQWHNNTYKWTANIVVL